MVKHTQTIPRQFADNCLSVFDHFVRLKGLMGRVLLYFSSFPFGFTLFPLTYLSKVA